MIATPKTAMVLAAGLGTRLRPITQTLPKPLVEIAGKTLLDHAIDRLAEIGVERVVVNLHYLPDLIERQLGKRRDLEIRLSHEPELLDTGGGIAQALALLDERFTSSMPMCCGSTARSRRCSVWPAPAMRAGTMRSC